MEISDKTTTVHKEKQDLLLRIINLLLKYNLSISLHTTCWTYRDIVLWAWLHRRHGMSSTYVFMLSTHHRKKRKKNMICVLIISVYVCVCVGESGPGWQCLTISRFWVKLIYKAAGCILFMAFTVSIWECYWLQNADVLTCLIYWVEFVIMIICASIVAAVFILHLQSCTYIIITITTTHMNTVHSSLPRSAQPVKTDSQPPWVWICWRSFPVKKQFFLSTVAKCFLIERTVDFFFIAVRSRPQSVKCRDNISFVMLWCCINEI